jgi:molybdopterin synthase sulfur carrier subunit
MKIKTLFFGITADLVGQHELEAELEKSVSIADFKTFLKEKFPKLTKINAYAVAVNEAYAEDDYSIKEGDIVAVIPPVSGG